jgi:hypothetical protein
MAKVEFKGTERASVDETLKFVQGTDTMAGFEDLTQQTMAIPFVRILQQLSPQVNKKDPAYVEGAEEGLLFNTITKEVLGSSVSVIALKFERIFIEWKPQRQGLVGYHTPEHAEQIAVDKTFGAWKTKDGNILAETYVYMVLIEGHEKDGIAVISLSSSSIKVAKTWNRLMTTHILSNGKKAMPYYMVWKFSAEYVSNDKGNWYRPKVEFVRYINANQYLITSNERKTLPPSRNLDLRQIEGAQEEPTAEY